MGQLNLTNSNMSHLFCEKTVICYEINEDILYSVIKDLTYKEYKSFKSDFILEAVNKCLVTDTNEAKQKFWERLINCFKERYGFAPPISDNPDAIRKRYQRNS